MRVKAFNNTLLERYRNVNCEKILPMICDYLKEDSAFQPMKNINTRRWNIHIAGRYVELLTTGPKWFDVRANKGGGGAIDLIIHLMDIDFVSAVKFLRKKMPLD